MNGERVLGELLTGVALLGVALLTLATVLAHCDGMGGPVVKAAQSASNRSIEPSGSTSLIWRRSYGYETNEFDENEKVQAF